MSETSDCPRCGHEHEAEYEVDDGDECTCQQCGFRFTVHSELVMTYSTECVEHEYDEWTKRNSAAGLIDARFCKHCWACELRNPE